MLDGKNRKQCKCSGRNRLKFGLFETRTLGATGPLVLAPAEGMGALRAPFVFLSFFVFFVFLSFLSFCLFCIFCLFLYFLSFCLFCLFVFFLYFCLVATTIIIMWSISTTTQIFVPIQQFFNFGAGVGEEEDTSVLVH